MDYCMLDLITFPFSSHPIYQSIGFWSLLSSPISPSLCLTPVRATRVESVIFGCDSVTLKQSALKKLIGKVSKKVQWAHGNHGSSGTGKTPRKKIKNGLFGA